MTLLKLVIIVIDTFEIIIVSDVKNKYLLKQNKIIL